MNTIPPQIPNLKPLFPIGRCRLTEFDFINQIDRMYTGLGIPTLYGTLSILANKSVFYIAGKGLGKTRVINLIPKIEGTTEKRMDTFTLSALDGYEIQNEHLVIRVEDFSSTSEYHRETFLRVFSKIISDGSYNHHTKGPNGVSIDIKNCRLTVLAAVQPLLYSNLCNKFTEWQSMSSDRFSKFMLLNPLRSETIDEEFVPTLPREIRDNVRFSSNDVDLGKVVSMYERQLSSGRAFLYARDYVKAFARFLAAEKVEQKHVFQFYQLFHPYLESFNVLQEAKDLDSPIVVNTGKMKLLTQIARHSDVVDKKKLADILCVTERHIERCAEELLNIGLIEKPRQAEYCLSKDLRQFFKWYSWLSS